MFFVIFVIKYVWLMLYNFFMLIFKSIIINHLSMWPIFIWKTSHWRIAFIIFFYVRVSIFIYTQPYKFYFYDTNWNFKIENQNLFLQYKKHIFYMCAITFFVYSALILMFFIMCLKIWKCGTSRLEAKSWYRCLSIFTK